MSVSVKALSWTRDRDDDRVCGETADERAFERLYHDHIAYVRGAVRRYLWGAAVDDVVQETFAQAYRSGLHLDPDGEEAQSVAGRLAAIARNRSIDILRQRMRGLDEIADDGRLSRIVAAGSDADPEHRLLAMRRQDGIAEALDALCDRQRRVVVLHYVEGRSYEEIATAENMTVSAVKATLFRGRRTFRYLYASIAEREGLSVIFGHRVLARLRARLRQTRERVASAPSDALGHLAPTSPGLAQAIVTAVVVGSMAVVGAATAAAAEPQSEPAPSGVEESAPAAGEPGAEQPPASQAHPGSEPEVEGSSEASGEPEAEGTTSDTDEAHARETAPRDGVHSQTSASVDSDTVAPGQDPPGDASADAQASADVDPESRRARSDQSGEGRTGSAVTETSTAVVNDVEAARSASTNTQTSNRVGAGCLESTEHQPAASRDACSLVP